MALITWSPSLSVGVHQCDEQHKKLVGLVNDLHAAMAGGKGNQAVGPVLDGLLEYTRTHFKDEEWLLSKYGYPGLARQQSEHRHLLEQVQALQVKFRAGKAVMSIEVMNFLKNWLVTHIQVEDAQYTEFLNSKGVR